ncbi:DNA helicase ATP-dependent RecQ type [Lasiodiplodia theobromae]|uniref:DNA helicase ATP-dependent RecQ type n=1 Tax=Lasiodiplodia theobromae TaxID=45133 RepID=UPI0015C3C0EF|nr:DNA helicase ATP-dependent RecQ type [Lasiodiplodia theobromae]KAF4534198.1 DNA helicase ATP-dependent RecQ type [Lasiodiplodia theobromae]
MAPPNSYFDYLPEYHLPVCKHCKHAVCLNQIRTHLRGRHHELPSKETAAALADVEHQWTDAAKDVSEVYIPSRYFQVDQVDGSDEEGEEEEEKEKNTGPLAASQEGDLIRKLVERDLQDRDRRISDTRHVYHDEATKTEVSPWLEMSRWPSFFHGLNLSKISTLAYAADPTEEPLLAIISKSLDRLVERAYQSICQDKISVFDQARINSFIAGEPSGTERLLMIGRLLRCIFLLDQNIRGSHFESPVLSFLAVLGIDDKKDCGFHGPLAYSPQLSKFIKIAQMLVIERDILAADEGAIEYPSDLLDEMRQRFMVRGSRSAFDWACQLRAYAKKVVSNTTVTGYIICDQVRQAQQELRGLLLVHPEENHEEIVPTFHLHRLQDDHSNSQNRWSFLQDPKNAAEFGLPGGSDSWLMNRVLDNDWLRDEFVRLGKKRELRWMKPAVSQYLIKVDYFLERLLLLVHLTSGQPARGTELVSLQHSNTRQGHHRSIVIENGLLGTVTSYHKGYNVTGSTKIIHRYLPREVSELLVYYLWLILPFWQKLETLAFKRLENSSSFLWPKGAGGWDSSKLGAVLAREISAYLGVKLNVMTYRHIAIANSRQHLRCGGFKRDY